MRLLARLLANTPTPACLPCLPDCLSATTLTHDAFLNDDPRAPVCGCAWYRRPSLHPFEQIW